MRLISWVVILALFCGAPLPSTTEAGWPPSEVNPLLPSAASVGPSDRVAAYLRRSGMPVSYTEAHALGPEALPELVPLLRNTHYKWHWFVIVSTISFIQDPAGFPVLRDFIFDRFHGEVDDTTYTALSSVVLSMGPLAARSDSAFQFLVRGTDPSFWTRVAWTNKHHKGEYLHVLLSELSISQVGESGRHEAVPILERLMKAPFSERQIGSIKDGLRIQREVEAVGPDDYYHRLGRPNVATDSLPREMY